MAAVYGSTAFGPEVTQPRAIDTGVSTQLKTLLNLTSQIARAAVYENLSLRQDFRTSCSTRVTVFVGNISGPSGGGNNDGGKAAFIILGTIAVIAGLILWYNIEEKNKDLEAQVDKLAQKELDHWKNSKLAFNSSNPLEKACCDKIQDTVDLAGRIHTRLKNDYWKKVAFCAIPLVVGGAAMIIGGVYAITALAVGGTVAALAATVYGLYKMNDTSVTSANATDGMKILDNVHELTGEYKDRFNFALNINLHIIVPSYTYVAHRMY